MRKGVHLKPGRQVVKRFFPCDITHQYYTIGVQIIRASDGFESLLSRCIPDRELDLLVVLLDSPDFEIDAGRHVCFLECPFGAVSPSQQY